jgi:TonB-dependent starch-binding outer membrane protein SusC
MRKSKETVLKRLWMFVFCGLIAMGAHAQTVTGRVTDSKDGSGLPGVTVNVKGTKKSTTTSADGSYSISAPGTATLVFSSVGYDGQQVAVGGRTTVDVMLVQGTNKLNEVVVVGYGTARKKDLTGSVATVTSKDFNKGFVTTPEQLIAGKVAGVSVISNGGAPGSGSRIRIRGGSSLNASNDPLIVLDGVPLDNSSISGAANPLSLINSDDIESFTVLKDASASAIYGSRASNGVIIITTKKGRSGKMKVSFSTVASVSKIIKEVPVLTADEVRTIVKEKGTPDQIAQLGNANTNWQDKIYHTAFGSDNNLSISGALDKVPFRVSLGYLNQDGILRTDNISKTSVALSVNPMFLNNHLKVDFNVKGIAQKSRFADQGAIGNAIGFDPTQPVTVNSNRFGGYFEWLTADQTKPNANAGKNPVGLLMQTDNKSLVQRGVGNLQLDYKFPFFPNLHANLNLGFDVSKGQGTVLTSDSAAQSYTNGGSFSSYRNVYANTLADFYLNYTRDFKRGGNVDLVVGHSYNDYLTKNYNLPTYNVHGVQISPAPASRFTPYDHNIESYFARGRVNLADRYLLTATIRRDGSSRFAKENRWGNFPSVAFAWRIKGENFMRNNSLFSDLKLRVGYGVTGQQEGIDNYAYLLHYSLAGGGSYYNFGGTYVQPVKPSSYYAGLKWEETATTNAAIDYGFFGNRLTGSVDFYIKKTKDLLALTPQAAGTNFGAYALTNIGNMENKGVEASIYAQLIKKPDFGWDISYNITYNQNKITYIPLPFTHEGLDQASGGSQINEAGYGRSTFFVYRQIYDNNGKPIEGMFEDKNRDGIINDADKYHSKQADPAVYMGFSTNLSYKNFTAGFVLRASIDNYVMNNVFSGKGRLNQIIGSQTSGNGSRNYLETQFTGTTDKEVLSDYYLENASYLKMDNLYIGYNFGSVFRKKVALRGSLTAQNVFTITKYKGLDPEVGNGVDNNLYPRPRIISLGFNLDF